MSKPSLFTVGSLFTTMATAAYLTIGILSDDRRMFLPGATTHGHYQIELSCDACHTSFSGVAHEACIRCHGEELERAQDTHPESKFTDPRNAELTERIDATRCVTCHEEHVPERTTSMAVSVALDFCFHCHATIGEERPSHVAYDFHGCRSTGCHNFHDNTALYEEFLEKHLDEPDLLADPVVPALGAGRSAAELGSPAVPAALRATDADAPGDTVAAGDLLAAWEGSAHARAGVNCSGCHAGAETELEEARWTNRPDHDVCGACHEAELKGYLAGRHGMRLALELEAMRPSLARLPMHESAHHLELGCTSCHGAHSFDTRRAAIEACLGCHRDAHSLAYRDSPHHELWKEELAGAGRSGSGVSCATCHLPRIERKEGGTLHISVEHNQNDNLRPSEKMLRTVCTRCHGVGFSIDALADQELVRNNFRGRPGVHVESLDLVRRRAERAGATEQQEAKSP